MHRLAIIVVSYNVRDHLRRCLHSVVAAAARDTDRLRVELVVVDNASTDGSAAMVAAEFPQARLLANTDNVGFTQANNMALRALGFAVCTGSEAPAGMPATDEKPDFVLLLNPDTEIVDDALWQLVSFLVSHPEAGVCGARLQYGNGAFQHGAFAFPTLAQVALDLFPPTSLPAGHRLLDSRLNGRYARSLWQGRTPFAVDFVLGAAMLVRGAAIDQVGGLDEGYWMYCEEMDWCRRLHRNGWAVYAVPAALIIHHEGQSSRQRRWRAQERLWRSRFRFFSLYAAEYGSLRLLFLRGLVRLGMAWQRRQLQAAFARGEIDGIELAAALATCDVVGRL